MLVFYKSNIGRYGWTLNRRNIVENPNDFDFELLETILDKMKRMGLSKSRFHRWDETFHDDPQERNN